MAPSRQGYRAPALSEVVEFTMTEKFALLVSNLTIAGQKDGLVKSQLVIMFIDREILLLYIWIIVVMHPGASVAPCAN